MAGFSLENERDTLNLSWPHKSSLSNIYWNRLHPSSCVISQTLCAVTLFPAWREEEDRDFSMFCQCQLNSIPRRCLPRCHNHHIRIAASQTPHTFKQAKDFLCAPPTLPQRESKKLWPGFLGAEDWGECLAGISHRIRIDESEASYFHSDPRAHFFLPACPSASTMKFQSISLSDACFLELLPRCGLSSERAGSETQSNPHGRHHLPTLLAWKHS